MLVNSLFSYIAEQQLPNWAENLRNMVRKPQAGLMPTRVRKSSYGNPGANGEFIWNAPAVDTEEDNINDTTVWKTGQVSGMKQYQDYVNNGEYIILAIEGQVEPALWDKTRGDIRFAAIQAAKCPIDLIKLMKERATGTQSGPWSPLAYITHLQKNIGHQQYFRGSATSIGEFKREVESGVATLIQLRGKLAYRSTIMEPFLTDDGETLETYFAMNPVQQAPYEALYKDMVVTIIMLKNC